MMRSKKTSRPTITPAMTAGPLGPLPLGTGMADVIVNVLHTLEVGTAVEWLRAVGGRAFVREVLGTSAFSVASSSSSSSRFLFLFLFHFDFDYITQMLTQTHLRTRSPKRPPRSTRWREQECGRGGREGGAGGGAGAGGKDSEVGGTGGGVLGLGVGGESSSSLSTDEGFKTKTGGLLIPLFSASEENQSEGFSGFADYDGQLEDSGTELQCFVVRCY
ncbi:hypothetical protein B0H16DRAFT_1797885 [Mycena metata]|uniref:Uncharacterized protein n=1 Tax=Mycena metata TaxID=1033252 RepID=A0AAD7HE68_9AGAR|nr:hypothetical protein B0H16DRAFT_1797885 [Mycena metata]